MKKTVLIVFLITLITVIYAENKFFSVSGKVYFTHQKPIYIYLVDEESSKKPFTGIDSLAVTPDLKDVSNGYIRYIFYNIKPGKYGIRCFQDINENEKLDRGFSGPSEPWGLSWNESKTTNWPSFKNFCFSISNDKNDVNVLLKD